MRDGVHLATDVVQLDDGERRPVLLIRTPYSRPAIWQAHDPISYARRGWVVVLQDVRGRGGSEGEFVPFLQEVDDGFDTIAWCAQQPWSDGTVTMTGYSYNGAVQWLAAMSRPPALKAISPSVIGVDFLNDFAYEGGAFQQGFLSAWAIGLAASSPNPELAKAGLALIPQWPDLLLAEGGNEQIATALPAYGEWLAGSPDYWKTADVASVLPSLDLPVWRLAGWYDTFCEGTLAGFEQMADHATAPQRLIVGPWTHIGMFSQATPELDFGPEGNGLLLASELEAFLRAGTEGKGGVTVFVMGRNAWQDLPSWPPPSTPRLLHLGPGGTLAASAVSTATVSWRHDPGTPVPTRGGRTLQGGLPLAGPADQRPNELRSDVVVWTSAELTEDLTVIGPITAQLELTSTASRFDVSVKVCDVHPDGRSLNVVDTIRRLSSGVATIVVGSTAQTFLRGHRIRVTLASSDYPRFDLLPSAEQTVTLGSSTLTLPVVTGDFS